MRASDRYRVASVTKTFVSTVVLQLEAEGRLNLDDSVERWLPGLVPNGTSMTLRELLNHTSGLFNYDEDEAFTKALIADPGRQWSPRELVSIAVSHPALFPPGTDWSYSNTNYVLLGLVIEAATGRTLDQELQERIFGPLALGATSFPAGTAIEGHFAHGCIGPAPGLPIPRGTLLDISSILNPSYSWGAGNIVSNADDLTSFFAALLGGRLLPPAELKAMKTVVPAAQYGLGLRVAYPGCGTAYGHDGDFPGYRNVVWASAAGRAVSRTPGRCNATRPKPEATPRAPTRPDVCFGRRRSDSMRGEFSPLASLPCRSQIGTGGPRRTAPVEGEQYADLT